MNKRKRRLIILVLGAFSCVLGCVACVALWYFIPYYQMALSDPYGDCAWGIQQARQYSPPRLTPISGFYKPLDQGPITLSNVSNVGELEQIALNEKVGLLQFGKDGELQGGYLNMPNGVPYSPVYTPDRTAVLVPSLLGSGGLYIRECDLATGVTRRVIVNFGFPLQFSPDKSILAVVNARGVELFDAKTYQAIAALDADGAASSFYPSSSLAFSPDGKLLAFAAEDDGNRVHDIQLWDVRAHTRVGVLQGHTDRILSLTFSTDGSLLASSSRDGSIRIWGIAQQK